MMHGAAFCRIIMQDHSVIVTFWSEEDTDYQSVRFSVKIVS